MIGKKLANRYQILEKIGGGGMAIVYKARCTLLNRIVAVKVLRPQFVHDEEFVRKFRREAQASASLSHPNIVGVYDVGQEKSDYFIVMEYVDGMTLKEYIQSKGCLQIEDAMKIAKEVAEALVHAHENSIIHRDIKPHNILLTQSKRVKVTDFGIAKAITSNTITAQNTNSIMGSVHYFSPEQAKGNYTGVQSDIYSLGIVMYEMLTGQLPFDGESPISIAIKHIQEKVRPIDEIKPDIPKDVQKLVEKCLQKNKDLRYNNVNELLDDIKIWLKFGKVHVEISEFEDQQTQTFIGINKTKEKENTPKEKSIKRKIIIWTLVAISVLALSVAGFFGLRDFFVVPEVVVPNVEGLTLNQAIVELRNNGLEYSLTENVFHGDIPLNHVVFQNPIPNSRVKRGRVITLTLSGGPEIISVPEVLGFEQREARIRIEQVGLIPQFEEEYSDTVPEGRVVRQSPLGGNVHRGETVTVVISRGRETVDIPEIKNLTIEEATIALNQLQITVREIIYQPARNNSPSGIVIGHSQQENPRVAKGTAIDLYVRPFEERSRNFRVDHGTLNRAYSLRVVVTDLGGQRTVFDSVVDPDEGELNISVSVWERGKVEFFSNNQLTDTKFIP